MYEVDCNHVTINIFSLHNIFAKEPSFVTYKFKPLS